MSNNMIPVAAAIVMTKLSLEEIARIYRWDDLDLLNDEMADLGLSQCVQCERWVYVIDVEDWLCEECAATKWEGMDRDE